MDYISQNELNFCTKQEKLFSFLVVLMAWANTYCIPGSPLQIGEMLILVFVPFYYRRGMNFSFRSYETGFVLWLAYAIFLTLAVLVYFGAPLSKLFSVARVLFYWVVIFILGKNFFNLDYFKKWMTVFAIALSIFIIFQSVVYSLFGYFIPGLILNAPVNSDGVTGLQVYEHTLRMTIGSRGYLRPNGFLSEPAASVQILFISLICVITDTQRLFSSKVKLSLLYTLAIVMTFSSTGVVLLLFSWLVFISIENRLSVFRIPLIVVSVLGFFAFISGSPNGENGAVERLVNVVDGSEIDASSNIRLFGGLELIRTFPLQNLIFGTGIGLFEYVSHMFDFGNAENYMNTFSGIIFMSGLVGALVWNASLLIMFLRSGLLGKSLTVGFFIMTLGCSIFCQVVMVWIFLLVFADIRKKNEINPRYIAS